MPSYVRHDSSADINKVPFEIGRAFYPPPNITLPEINIPPPSEVKYDFKRELEVIEHYRQEQLKHTNVADVDGNIIEKPNPIDIISKVSYLSISAKNKNVNPSNTAIGTVSNPEVSSISNTPLLSAGNIGNITQQPTSAANLLPSYSYPQLL